MKKIDWDKPILGADGVVRDRETIEKFFTDLFESTIKNNLNGLTSLLNEDERTWFGDYLEWVIGEVHQILLKKPSELEVLKNDELTRKRTWIGNGIPEDAIKSFYKKVHNAFNYNGFRKAKLNRLAVVLNVKTCLYCNQQYTIAVGKNPNKDGNINLSGSKAFLQFDHFFGEKEYPVLSMSLYNLIPSCPFCNQKKSGNHLSLQLHPYENDLSSMMRFRIKNKEAFINPKFKNLDLLEVEIDTYGDVAVRNFVENLSLEKRYARHLDIVQELEIALYMAPYYAKYLDTIIPAISKDGKEFVKRWDALQRHFKGFYSEAEDINKRPLTKFSQDIYTQLCSWYEGL